MKTLLLSFFLGMTLCVVTPVRGQFTIQHIEVVPAHPTPTEEVKVTFHIVSPNQPVSSVYLRHERVNDSIEVEGCFYQGAATSPGHFYDTLSLGILPAGNYQVLFDAYLSNDSAICDMSASDFTSVSFTVSGSSSVSYPGLENKFAVYPNPVIDVLFVEDDEALVLLDAAIIDSEGKMLQQHPGNFRRIDVSSLPKGLYFLRLRATEGQAIIRFVKE